MKYLKIFILVTIIFDQSKLCFTYNHQLDNNHQHYHHHHELGLNNDDDGPSEKKNKNLNANNEIHHNWRRYEIMDSNGLYILEWWTKLKEIYFRVTVNTRGFIGLGFSKKTGKMANSDLILLWIDDRTGKPNVLDCHGPSNGNGAPIQDDTQNYNIIDGFQNATHTQIEFSRELETCDPHDLPIGTDTIKILWSFGDTDPTHGNLKGHSLNRGAKPMHLLGPMFRKPTPSSHQDIKQWDVTVRNVTVDVNMDTLYWCKIFKAPELNKKHHIIGYEALLTRESLSQKPLVHHMTLFECSISSYPGSDSASWDVWVKSAGAVCNSNLLTPRDWDSCITPVAVWAVGSNGQFLPQHVGFAFGERKGAKFYMLEIHYDNPNSKKIIDNSGFRIHYTKNLRKHDGGMMISGVSVSDTQLIPPAQKLYRNIGICGPSCTAVVFPDDGIKIISATLHSHNAGRKMKLRHIRNGTELKRIVEDDNYDYNYQQVRQFANETTILPGDYVITDCSYETIGRRRPVFGGYSTKQEICLSFLTYYPKINLAGCYSMTPVREFFATFGVYQFYSLNMTDVENLFLYNGNLLDLLPTKVHGNKDIYGKNDVYLDEEDVLYQESLLNKLVISDPVEFHDRTFLMHLTQLPWSEPLFTKTVEQNIITGKHMTFCRISNDSITIPSEIIRYPNFTTYVKPPSLCPYQVFESAPINSLSQKKFSRSWLVLCMMTNIFIHISLYFISKINY